jgi:hypothetical protein
VYASVCAWGGKLAPPEIPPGHPDHWKYGTGDGAHNSWRCQALRRYLAEGGIGQKDANGAIVVRQFRLIVDHAALKWLHSMKDTMEGGPASRLMRWILKLSEYRFTIEHKPGVQHKDADGVSRLVAAVFG